MAAICGKYYFEKNQRVDKSDLEAMIDKMAHRGDGEPLFNIQNNIGLACRYPRSGATNLYLSSCSENSAIGAVIDGRIFIDENVANNLTDNWGGLLGENLPELIAYLYREKDIEFLSHLNGGFTIAIGDRKKNKLILARDRFGTKPLYYFADKNGIAFASEIKAILAILKEKCDINLGALSEYLTFRYVAGPSTMFAGVKELLPGYYITWSGANRRENRYWSVEDIPEDRTTLSIDNCECHLKDLLERSIGRRIKNIKRVGANCSGGIDSGLVTALSGRLMEDPLNTFTIGYDEKEWDERHFAELTARKYATKHHELIVKSEQFSSQLHKLNWYNDEPLSDPNSVLVYLLAKYSKEKIDILLTGEGADEVFLGYPRYNMLKLYSISRILPGGLKWLLINSVALSKNRKIKKLTATLKQSPCDAIALNSAFVQRQTVQNILREDIQSFSFQHRYDFVQELDGKEFMLKGMDFEIKTYLLCSLNRLDKMNMACGLEAVAPFLDNELFEFALKMPCNLKIKYFSNKCILRGLAAKYLPAENLKMPKSGFGVPISNWFQKDHYLRELFDDLLQDSFMKQIFIADNLKFLIMQHQSGHDDHSEILWLILNFYLWHDRFFSCRC